MSTREELAQRVLVLRGLRMLVQAEENAIRAELDAAFHIPGQREPARLLGQDLGSVQLIKGSSSWKVTDPDAWQAWVEAHNPGEIVTTKTVRSSYTDAVLAKLKAGGAEIDEETGEAVVPPGIAPTFSAPSIRVSPSKEAPRIVLDALGDAAVLIGLAEHAELEAS